MRKLLLLGIVGSFFPMAIHAEIDIPSSAFTMEEIEEARAEAVEKEEPLVFVYTDPGST